VGYLEGLNIFIIVLQDIAGQCKTVEDSAGECRKGWEVYTLHSVGQCKPAPGCRKVQESVCQCGTV
jgi:hypothetical protein